MGSRALLCTQTVDINTLIQHMCGRTRSRDTLLTLLLAVEKGPCRHQRCLYDGQLRSIGRTISTSIVFIDHFRVLIRLATSRYNAQIVARHAITYVLHE